MDGTEQGGARDNGAMTADEPAVDPLHEPLVTLEVWADVVCPWCYIGKRRIERAIAEFEHPAEVAVHYRSFELDPVAPIGGGLGVQEQLAERYGGGPAGARAMTFRVTDIAAGDGLGLQLDRAVRANSFDANRLAQLGRAQGGLALQAAVLERLFAAHFTEGKAIDDHEVLQRLGAEAGLDERRLAAILAADDYAAQVREDEALAQELGVTGVPFAVANRKVAVSGAQPVETFVGLLRQAWDAVAP